MAPSFVWLSDTDSTLSPVNADAWPDAYLYLVSWLDGVSKVGSASRPSRWRSFVNRGATIQTLIRGASLDVTALEGAVHDRAVALGARPAFAQKQLAAAHLGPGCHGWLECYAESPTALDLIVREEVDRALVQG